MIDYSLAMMANPMNENDPQRAYAFLQSRATLAIDEIADHMVQHGCQYDRGDIIAIIVKLVSCAKELMLDGYRIQLGDLGIFYLTCKSKGAQTMEDFTRANITSINVRFDASAQFADMVQKASLHKAPTRKALAATLEAQLKGQTSADWSADGTNDDGE
ncbi:MAG: hypothetical protein IJT75_10790 [Bacteroidaceae bacterium]|nr:hypothetical protein [Bacteroidaceae bacterium]